ncbi:MAG TPA: ComF family protein [Candidatus Cloacimonadota bacterium]|nr:ComF family protein [Candidatus Cloacimonadota bacterium]
MDKSFLPVLKNGLKTVCDLIFPRACINCQSRLSPTETYLCESCFKQLILLKTHIRDEWEIPVKYFDRAYSIFRYDGPVRQCIHFLKYEEYTHIAEYMAILMLETGGLKVPVNYDFVIPVPLHPVKKRERGYNQAELFANAIAKRLGLSVELNIVTRNRYTETQTLKSHQERISNVSHAFKCYTKADIQGKKILLVDDVVTTGSTINSIAQLLKERKAKRVDILTFAFANIGKHQTV